MTALPPEADIKLNLGKGPLVTQSGHRQPNLRQEPSKYVGGRRTLERGDVLSVLRHVMGFLDRVV